MTYSVCIISIVCILKENVTPALDTLSKLDTTSKLAQVLQDAKSHNMDAVTPLRKKYCYIPTILVTIVFSNKCWQKKITQMMQSKHLKARFVGTFS